MPTATLPAVQSPSAPKLAPTIYMIPGVRPINAVSEIIALGTYGHYDFITNQTVRLRQISGAAITAKIACFERTILITTAVKSLGRINKRLHPDAPNILLGIMACGPWALPEEIRCKGIIAAVGLDSTAVFDDNFCHPCFLSCEYAVEKRRLSLRDVDTPLLADCACIVEDIPPE